MSVTHDDLCDVKPMLMSYINEFIQW